MNRLEERVADQIAKALARQFREQHTSPLSKISKADLDAFAEANAISFVDQAIAALSALEAQGLKIVPVEPTEAMKLAGGMIPDTFKGTGAARGNAARIYAAMLNAVEG